MNKISLIGRLTRDPEIRWSTANDNLCIARIGIAVDRRTKSRDVQQVDFLNCTAFGKMAEHIEKYWRKGMKAGITGRLQASPYTDKAGNKRVDHQIIIEEIDFCERKEAIDAGKAAQEQNDFRPVDDGDEGLPFQF